MGQVTLKDIYEVVDRLENKIDGKIANLEKDVDRNADDIGQLKSWRDRALGVLLFASILIPLIAQWLWERIVR